MDTIKESIQLLKTGFPEESQANDVSSEVPTPETDWIVAKQLVSDGSNNEEFSPNKTGGPGGIIPKMLQLCLNILLSQIGDKLRTGVALEYARGL